MNAASHLALMQGPDSPASLLPAWMTHEYTRERIV